MQFYLILPTLPKCEHCFHSTDKQNEAERAGDASTVAWPICGTARVCIQDFLLSGEWCVLCITSHLAGCTWQVYTSMSMVQKKIVEFFFLQLLLTASGDEILREDSC